MKLYALRMYLFFDFFFYACQPMIESQGRKAKVANKTRNILHPAAVQAVFEVEFDLCAFAQCSKPQIPPGMPVSMG